MSYFGRSLASWLLAVALPLALLAQARDRGEVVVHAYTLKHQPAREAMALVVPLLSQRGTVELQPGGNTLVIRDTLEVLQKVVPVLRGFDHEARPLRLEILIVRASRATVSPPMGHPGLPEELARQLREMLPYENYELEAQAQLTNFEGEAVTYQLGDTLAISFRLGTVMADKRVKLLDFRLTRHGPAKAEQELLHTNLNLRLDKTMSLGLAKSAASPDALMVVLTVRNAKTPRVAGRVR